MNRLSEAKRDSVLDAENAEKREQRMRVLSSGFWMRGFQGWEKSLFEGLVLRVLTILYFLVYSAGISILSLHGAAASGFW